MTYAATAKPGHWSLGDIPFDTVDRDRIRQDESLLYILAAGSFIEIASDLYTRNLVTFLADDPEATDWLTGRWEPEEVQHGQALRRYVETVWPDFPWTEAYNRFFADYSRFCSVDQLDSSPTLEMAARCVVETGTATFYRMLSEATDEPVLKDLAARISADEIHHYKHFHTFFERYRLREGTSSLAIAYNLWRRLGEIPDEDVRCAFNAVYAALNEGRPAAASDYDTFRAHQAGLARAHYPFDMAAKMLAKPLGLSPMARRVTTPLLIMVVRRMIAH